MIDKPRRKIRFGHLRQVLLDLGYEARIVDRNHIAFIRPGHDLFVVLPDLPAESDVMPTDLWSVQKTLMNDGVIETEQQFSSLFLIKKGDRLIWTEPRSGIETEVIAASGETSDGMVIIKQKGGAFSPCPVDQLKLARAVSLRV